MVTQLWSVAAVILTLKQLRLLVNTPIVVLGVLTVVERITVAGW